MEARPASVADAELYFEGGVLEGMKVIGFAVWGRRGGRWSMDFMRGTFTSGRPFRTFNVVDDSMRENHAIAVDRSLPGSRVVLVLDPVHGYPTAIVCDNGAGIHRSALDQ